MARDNNLGLRIVSDPSAVDPFPVLLRARREDADLTQAQLGKLLGCSQQRVGAWEKKWERPTDQYYDGLVKFLDLHAKSELIDLLDLMPAHKALAAPEQPHEKAAKVSVERAETMLDLLASSLVERGPDMSPDEQRSHRLLVEFYSRVTTRS